MNSPVEYLGGENMSLWYEEVQMAVDLVTCSSGSTSFRGGGGGVVEGREAHHQRSAHSLPVLVSDVGDGRHSRTDEFRLL